MNTATALLSERILAFEPADEGEAMARRGDALVAILLHAFPFFLLHGNKPEIELLSSFVGGIFAGWFCLRARTFFPLYVIHIVMITTVGFTSFVMRNGL